MNEYMLNVFLTVYGGPWENYSTTGRFMVDNGLAYERFDIEIRDAVEIKKSRLALTEKGKNEARTILVNLKDAHRIQLMSEAPDAITYILSDEAHDLPEGVSDSIILEIPSWCPLKDAPEEKDTPK